MDRHQTYKVKIGNIYIGGGGPIIVQSMTNTDTADANSTAMQIIELANAGSSIVRITVNNIDSIKSIPNIKEILNKYNCHVPIVGDFHYNGHTLLKEYPESARVLDKYRINPGNVGFGEKRDKQFEMIIEQAIKNDKPVRIGVNWGSLDQTLLTKLMDENASSATPQTGDEILKKALVDSVLISAELARKIGLPEDKIVLSCKVSKVNELVSVYQTLSEKSNYALHLGLTEAGMGNKGIISSSVALGVLLNQGIGDTIRVSITPEPNQSRSNEVLVAQEILQSLELGSFKPQVTACPGCGRTTSTFFQELTKSIDTYIQDNNPLWKSTYKDVSDLKIAVMGCIVNGPGESKHANIGISLPGTGESPVAPVFIDGVKAKTLRGENIDKQFIEIINDYIENKYEKLSG